MAKAKRFIINNNTNAVCYYRYSSDAQNEDSIEQQREVAHRYAAERGMKIVAEFEDKAKSGTSSERPGLQHMMSQIKKIKPAYLIVWKMDRLARNVVDTWGWIGVLQEAGVQLECVAEPLPEDNFARLIVQGINAARAEAYIDDMTANLLRALNRSAENCLYIGRQIYGYSGKKQQPYTIKDDEAAVVLRVFKDYADGKPAKVICDELSASGIRNLRGNEFNPNTLARMLQNRAYIGEYSWGEHVTTDGMPRIVSDDLFEKVQEMLQKHKKGGRGEATRLHPELGIDFWLTGHLYCKKCGTVMNGISGTGKKGKIYYYYTCMDKKRHKCDVKPIRKELLEKCVTGIMNELLNDSALKIIISQKVFEYYQREYSSEDNYADLIKNNLKDCESRLNNIMKAIEQGIFNDTTAKRMKELEALKEQLTQELALEEARKEYRLTPGIVLKYLEEFTGKANNPDVRRRILDSLIDKIYVDNETISVTFYFSDDKREINIVEFLNGLDNLENLMEALEHSNYKGNPEMLKKSGLLGTDFFG